MEIFDLFLNKTLLILVLFPCSRTIAVTVVWKRKATCAPQSRWCPICSPASRASVWTRAILTVVKLAMPGGAPCSMGSQPRTTCPIVRVVRQCRIRGGPLLIRVRPCRLVVINIIGLSGEDLRRMLSPDCFIFSSSQSLSGNRYSGNSAFINDSLIYLHRMRIYLVYPDRM